MPALVNIDGRLVPPEQAFVPVLDRGFLYGDSVYEVVRTYAGRPFELDRHLERLDRSAARIGLTLPPRARIEGELARTLQTAGNPESYARIVVTRGEGRFGLSPHLAEGLHRLIVIVRPLEAPAAELYERGPLGEGPGADLVSLAVDLLADHVHVAPAAVLVDVAAVPGTRALCHGPSCRPPGVGDMWGTKGTMRAGARPGACHIIM